MHDLTIGKCCKEMRCIHKFGVVDMEYARGLIALVRSQKSVKLDLLLYWSLVSITGFKITIYSKNNTTQLYKSGWNAADSHTYLDCIWRWNRRLRDSVSQCISRRVGNSRDCGPVCWSSDQGSATSWTHPFPTPCLGFFVCKMRKVVGPSHKIVKNSKWVNKCDALKQCLAVW